MCVHLRANFEVSSVILTSFRQSRAVILLPFPPQNEPLKSQPRFGLMYDLICHSLKMRMCFQYNNRYSKSLAFLANHVVVCEIKVGNINT